MSDKNDGSEDKVLGRLDSIEEGILGKFESFETRLAALEAKKEEDTDPAEPAKAEGDDDTQENKRMDAKEFPSAFEEHRRALEAAEKLNLDSVSSATPTADIKRAVVKAKQGDDYRADASDQRLEGTFDALYPLIMADEADGDGKRTDSKFEDELAKGRLETKPRQDSNDEVQPDGAAWLSNVTNREAK